MVRTDLTTNVPSDDNTPFRKVFRNLCEPTRQLEAVVRPLGFLPCREDAEMAEPPFRNSFN